MKQKKNKVKRFFLIIASLLILIWTILAITQFITAVAKKETALANVNLSRIADSNAAEVSHTMNAYVRALTATAVAMQQYDDFRSSEAIAFMAETAKVCGYERMAVDYLNGITYTSDGFTFDITSMGYLDKLVEGKPFVRDMVDALVDGTPLMNILVPLHDQNGKAIAALRCAVTPELLSQEFDSTFVADEGYYRLIDENGRCIATNDPLNALTEENNYFSVMDEFVYQPGFSADQIKTAFAEREKGYFKYSHNGETRYAYYTPVDVNQWVMIRIVSQDVVQAQTTVDIGLAMTFLVQITLILILILFYISFTQRAAKNKAELNEKCFKVLAEQTSKVIFEWDFATNIISTVCNFNELFGRKAITYNSPHEAIDANMVHEEDHTIFRHVFDEISSGRKVDNARFRVRNNHGDFRWCSLSGVVVNDRKGHPYKAFGSLENIHEQMLKEQLLIQKAEKDQLTGLYNKITTEYRIKEMLQNFNPPECRSALLIIDIDNFKNVNDRLGHMYGDEVLAGLAGLLKPLFRANDVVGRIGGDEFFVFLNIFSTIDLVSKKAEEIGGIFQRTYTEKGVSVPISASIGISLYPDHGTDFDTLYQKADVALYNVKENGKNHFKIYDGQLSTNYHSTRTEIDRHSTPRDAAP